MNAPSPRTAAPGVNPTEIAIYLDVVFGYLEGLVPVRILSESGTSSQQPHLPFPSTQAARAEITRLAPRAAEKSRGVFVVPATVERPGSAGAADIIQTGVVLVDIDDGDIAAKADHLSRHLGEPTLDVASGGTTPDGQAKRHLYWRLTEAACADDLERVRRIREHIAEKVGADRSFKSLAQPVRVTGTIHGKNGRQSRVHILHHSAIEYDLGEFETLVEAMPELAGIPPVVGIERRARSALTAKDLKTREIRAGGIDDVTRFAALSSIIGHWIRNARTGVCTQAEACQAVIDHNAAVIEPPWPSDRLQREFDALLRLDIKKNGPMPEPTCAGARAEGLTPNSDDALAANFVARHGGHWRHVAGWGAWYEWSGTKWHRDETNNMRNLVRMVCRGFAQNALKDSEARRISSEKTVAAVSRLAATDPQVATLTSQWDAHSLILNTPSGIIDLTTGEVSEPDPDLLLSQVTSASAGWGCPRWKAFLADVTDGDEDLQSYLQRLAGYCLTGSTDEQAFVFLYGSGANGKSVFIQTIAAVLGDYACTATLDTFMASPGSRHLTELAGLRAARLVVVPETEVGRTWSEARIKTVTGGEKILANFMHRDHFEFTPQFKLIVAGNHRPALSSVGESMRRRLHVVRFDVTVPPENRDRNLAAKLIAERDGILGWMLEGCAEWQRIGLTAPQCVLAAANEYFAAEDLIGHWIDECCDQGPHAKATASNLFASWSTWADAGGHPRGTAKALGEALRQRGHQAGKVEGKRGWHGLVPRRSLMGAGEDR